MGLLKVIRDLEGFLMGLQLVVAFEGDKANAIE